MKKGKKFLTLFLAAALVVAGINVGFPSAVYAAGNSVGSTKDDGTKDNGTKDDGTKDNGSKDDGSKDDGKADTAILNELSAKITEAQTALADTSKLYTQAAKDTLQAAITAAQNALASFTAGVTEKQTVQDAIDTLENAINTFKASGTEIADPDATADDSDKAALEDKIAEARTALGDTSKTYTQAAKDTLQAAIDTANDVLESLEVGVTKKQVVQNAIVALQDAIDTFIESGEPIVEPDPDATADDADKAALEDKIAEARTALGDTSKTYTQAAKDTLQAAIDTANDVLESLEVGVTKKQTVLDAITALDTAINTFKASGTEITPPPIVVTVNKTQLQAAILAAQSLKASDYTTASWTPFQTALNNAISVNNNQNATQAQVDAARTALEGARLALKKAVKSLTITDNLTGAKSSKTVKVAAGKKVTLKATVAPTDAANKSVTWSIDKKYAKYAKVSSKGVVTTTKKGAGKTVVVKATANDGSKISKTVKIQIMGKMVTSVKFKKAPKTAKIGKSFTLKTTIKSKGKGKLNKTLKWTSSNTKIATVNSKGKVTISKKAKKGQKVKITAAATDGSGKKATVTIKIKK